MPRTAGVSASSTVWLIFFSPSPRTVSRWRCLMPASPFTRRTLILFTEDFLDLLAAARRDLRRRAHRLQAVQRGAHHVVGVGRAETLGEDVGDAHHLEHRAHRPAGDDARALVSRLHQHTRGAPAPGHGVMQRAVLQLYLEKLAPRLLHRLLHGHRHLARLALAHADAAVAVADHGERREAEHSAALHHLGDAVDRDHLLAQAVAALFRLLHPWLDFCHKSPGPRSLEFKSGGARRLRERLHAPMVFIAGAVESNLLDPLFLPLDGDALADDLGGFAVAAVLQLGPDVLLQRGSARNDLVARGGSELGIDVPVVRCTVRRTAPTARIRSRVWRARRRRARFLSIMASPLLLLGLLQDDDLAAVAHSLALVGLGRALRANLGGDLAHQLLVDAGDDDLGLRRRRHLDALGHLLHHRVREAERQIELVALRLRTESDADQRKALLEALGHAGDHVRDQRAHGARHGVGMARVAQRLALQLGAVRLDRDVRIGGALDRAERAFHRDLAGGDAHLDALRQVDRDFRDARHGRPYATMQSTSPPTPSARALRSVITPHDVERIATPSPFITRGMSLRPL